MRGTVLDVGLEMTGSSKVYLTMFEILRNEGRIVTVGHPAEDVSINGVPTVTTGPSLVAGTIEVPPFNRDALIKALRLDQAGESTFAEFPQASWNAGVVRYEVDFAVRTVSYYGTGGEEYVEAYPPVEV